MYRALNSPGAEDYPGVTAISITGEIKVGDQQQFSKIAVQVRDKGVVFFNSPGGNAYAGIQIGKTIRLLGFVTVVTDNETCASACALAWLGGIERHASSTSRIGFHAVFFEDTDKPSSAGNAVVGGYLNGLGLSENAIAYITATSPKEIEWLIPEDAASHGIEVKVDKPQQPESQTEQTEQIYLIDPNVPDGELTGR